MPEAVKVPEVAITPCLKFIKVDWQLQDLDFRTDKQIQVSQFHSHISQNLFQPGSCKQSCLLSTLGLLLREIGTKKLYHSG